MLSGRVANVRSYIVVELTVNYSRSHNKNLSSQCLRQILKICLANKEGFCNQVKGNKVAAGHVRGKQIDSLPMISMLMFVICFVYSMIVDN